MHAHNPFCLYRNCNTFITECNTAVENELLHKKSQCSATQNSSFTNLKVVYKNYIKHNKKTTAAGINNNVPPKLLNNSSMYTKTMQQKSPHIRHTHKASLKTADCTEFGISEVGAQPLHMRQFSLFSSEHNSAASFSMGDLPPTVKRSRRGEGDALFLA